MREQICAYAPIYEISNESSIVGRRKIKAVLHEIHPDPSVYQENGISWKEEYVQNNLPSVAGMSIVAEFLTEDRDIPYGHGETEIRKEDSLPLFEDATVVGHFENAYIDEIEIDGERKRVLIAEGVLDEMRYPKFVAWLREHMAQSVVKGSVEIVGKKESENRIIYEDGWKETGRVPQIYDYSGYAILSVKPADHSAVVMELNSQKEEWNMDEKTKKEFAEIISGALSEANSKWDQYLASVSEKETEITQLRANIKQKEAEIAQLQADYETAQAAQLKAEEGLAEANAKAERAEADLATANSKLAESEKQNAMSELNDALRPYTEDQQSVAKTEIDAFRENPGSVEINTIVGKICTEIVRAGMEERKKGANGISEIEVFGIIEHPNDENDDSEVDVF